MHITSSSHTQLPLTTDQATFPDKSPSTLKHVKDSLLDPSYISEATASNCCTSVLTALWNSLLSLYACLLACFGFSVKEAESASSENCSPSAQTPSFNTAQEKSEIAAEEPIKSGPSLDAILSRSLEERFKEYTELVNEIDKTRPPPDPISTLEDNHHKNRYPNVLSPERSRVKLQDHQDYFGNFSDYINASWLDSTTICTQAPLESTIQDFWKMVADNRVTAIVMLTKQVENGQTKCHNYLKRSRFYQIEIGEPRTTSSYLQTQINLKTPAETLTVEHLQFQDWPDHGVPASTEPLAALLKHTVEHVESKGGPIVIHCAAGLGRSGAFYLALQAALTVRRGEPFTGLQDILREARPKRPGLVQNKAQYAFAYQVLKTLNDEGFLT